MSGDSRLCTAAVERRLQPGPQSRSGAVTACGLKDPLVLYGVENAVLALGYQNPA